MPHKKARIEIIPLIDIMFFLLASFMLVSLSLVKLQGAKVDLPPAGKAPPPTDPPQKPDITTVFVDKDGNCLVGEKKTPVPLEQIPTWAKGLVTQKGTDAKVFIGADPTVNYGAVLAVLDRAKRGGLTRVTFTFKPTLPAGANAGTAGAPASAPAPAPPAPRP